MASLQQVVEQLALLAAANHNGTGGADASSPTSVSQGPLDLVISIVKMVFSAAALREWAILLVLGSLFETARRLLSSLWYWLINSFYVTAVFEDEDVSFQWIMLWLSKQPSWKGARNVQISTSNFDLQAVQIDSGDDTSVYSRNVTYLPAVSESYTLWYKYHWLRVTRLIESHQGGWSTRETLTLSIMTRDRGMLSEILRDARNEYIKAQKDKITIFVTARFQGIGWRELATRPKRPLSSIILDPGITDLVVEDIQDFLKNKEWYGERGIPFRRGYLLYGAPGSGKTSLIHSIAGEVGLDVYIISLSRSGLDDTSLCELISALPERCIALMEDIDAAFHHGLNRESPCTPSTQMSNDPDQQQENRGPPVPDGNRVSLSGLLNALDGIGAQEGRVLFATTNKYSSLDPALCRPGRMDLHIEFKLASQSQAEELFKRFYAPAASASSKERACTDGIVDGEVNEKECTSSGDLIDLSEARVSSTTRSRSSSSASRSEKTVGGDSPGPAYVGVSHRTRGPTLSLTRINQLATQFARAVPERELSMATLQGFLMMYKTRPFGAVEEVEAWVKKELAERKRVDGGV